VRRQKKDRAAVPARPLNDQFAGELLIQIPERTHMNDPTAKRGSP
jgi:hypothetical protein